MRNYKHYGRPKNWNRWGFAIANVLYECPRCGAPKEHNCITPKGRTCKQPHTERCRLLTPEQREWTRCEAITGAELIERLKNERI